MNIHTIMEKSKSNGPGTRYVVWFQGCSIKCFGCANQSFWDHGKGEDITPKELFEKIKEQKDIDGVSISGGEPLDQYEDLIELLELLHPDIEIFLTSGHTIDDIRKNYPKILELVDILIDGPFIIDQIDNTPAWRGSTNQGINFISEKSQKYKDYKERYLGEMVFKEDGSAFMTGFSNVLA